jgi:hypothetical protein
MECVKIETDEEKLAGGVEVGARFDLLWVAVERISREKAPAFGAASRRHILLH